MAITSKQDKGSSALGKPSSDRQASEGVARLRPGVADYIAGEASRFKTTLSPFLPQEVIGGAIPHIAGSEDEAVWNAASQACGTEKVHYCYSVDGGRVWYLACPSSALASAPDSWCPLAAALPGKSEFWDRETVYLYEQEGLASALRWDPDTGRMQVFLGAARTLLPRMQSMDANFVTINPEIAEIVPWKNRTLMTEKLSRAASMALLYVGIGINLLIIMFMIFQYIYTNSMIKDLDQVKTETQLASQQLMLNAYNALQSDSIKHMVRIQEILYEVQGGRVTWEALVPAAYGQGVGTITGQVLPGIEPDGRVRVQGNK
jgi:hypothetical protein